MAIAKDELGKEGSGKPESKDRFHPLRFELHLAVKYPTHKVMQPSPAYQVHILDPAMQQYLQRHPFANGPDAAMNRAARLAIKAGIRHVDSGTPLPVRMLRPDEIRLPEAAMRRLGELFADLELSSAKQADLLADFGWKAKLLPHSARRVLVLGCGDGSELLFLRACLPEAEILALDYGDYISDQQKRTIGMEFLGGDMHLHLKSLRPIYDLVFSHHTLEHLYAPEDTLATLFGLLVPGGTLVSALPMDANPGSPFLELVKRLTVAERVHPLDYVFLDAGHPWKTNPGNLNSTLLAAGFSEPALYQQAEHPARQMSSGRGMRLGQSLAVAGHFVLFGSLRSLLKRVFRDKVPEKLVKGLLAFERRTPFGANKVKSRYTHEVVIYATKGIPNKENT